MRRRHITRRHHAIPFELQLEAPSSPDLFARHLGFLVGPAIEQDPGRLERVGMTDTERDLARVFTSEPMHDVEHPASKCLDALVALQGAALQLMHHPFRSPYRDLPERHPLQIATELRLPQRRLHLERNRRGELGVDDLGGLAGALQRAVHDPLDTAIAQRLSNRRRLRPAEGAEVKAWQVTIENPVGDFHIGVPHQQQLGGRTHRVSLSIRSYYDGPYP